MVAIHAISGRTLALGREGENLARQVVFDISEWRASYGDGTVSLIAQRHGDAEPYPCNITVDGDTVTWPITSADTAHPDYGRCELRYSVGDVLVKSEMWRTFVADALGTPQPEPPEPQQAWVDKVLEAGQAAMDASVNPPRIGNNGNWWVWDFGDGAYVDTGVAASGGGGGAVSSVNGKTGAVALTACDVGAVSSPATAAVGQTIVVKAVDADGKPTAWAAADMAEPEFELIEEITLEETTSIIERACEPNGTPYNFTSVCIDLIVPAVDAGVITQPTFGVDVNGMRVFWQSNALGDGDKRFRLFVIQNHGSPVLFGYKNNGIDNDYTSADIFSPRTHLYKLRLPFASIKVYYGTFPAGTTIKISGVRA